LRSGAERLISRLLPGGPRYAIIAMKKLPPWPRVNEAFYGLAEAVKQMAFVTLAQ
jgi:hypothetical protein